MTGVEDFQKRVEVLREFGIRPLQINLVTCWRILFCNRWGCTGWIPTKTVARKFLYYYIREAGKYPFRFTAIRQSIDAIFLHSKVYLLTIVGRKA